MIRYNQPDNWDAPIPKGCAVTFWRFSFFGQLTGLQRNTTYFLQKIEIPMPGTTLPIHICHRHSKYAVKIPTAVVPLKPVKRFQEMHQYRLFPTTDSETLSLSFPLFSVCLTLKLSKVFFEVLLSVFPFCRTFL